MFLSHLTHGRQLIRSFGNCAEMNNYYVNRVLRLVGPYGLTSFNAYTPTRSPDHAKAKLGTPGGPAGLPLRRPFRDPKRVAFNNVTATTDAEAEAEDASAPLPDFSETNVQVTGVDEPDIVKTDGRRMFTLSGNVLSVIKVLDQGNGAKRVGRLKLPTYPREMLIEGDYLLVIGSDSSYKRPTYQRYKVSPSYGESSTVIYQIRVSDNWPRIVATLNLEGDYVKSRETNGVARIVMQFNPLSSIWLYYPTGKIKESQTKKWNREIIQYSRAGNWLPTYRLKRMGGVRYGVYAHCSDMFYSPTFAGFNMLTVVTLPVAGLLVPKSTSSILSNSQTVYATKKSMYVTTSEFRFSDVSSSSSRWGANYQTSIHKFSLSNMGAQYVASGAISGSVINQFAMHELKDVFFIATTDGASWWSNRDLSRSKLTAFETDVKARALRKIGQVGNLGIGERIFAVRYRYDTAYVVTFREVDPLYIIDLSKPRDLKVTGELKIPGFSSYLHLVGPGRVLGVGREATPTGITTGAKVSLFDVSDKSKPKELSVWSLKGSYSDASWDHRAFLYWWKERIAVLPVSVYSATETFSGAIVLDISDKKITERGRIVHKGAGFSPSILRNVVIGKNLWSMSNTYVQVNDIKKVNKVKARVKIDD